MRIAVAGLLIFVLAGCSDVTTAPPSAPPIDAALGASAAVTTNADAGPGSLRAALAAALADPGITHVRLERGLGTITLASPLVWSGAGSLAIDGAGATLDGSALGSGQSAFVANGGGDLAVRDLVVADAPGYGILVDVPAARTGTQRVDFDAVTIRDNGLHGVLINDQTEYLNDPNSTSEAGSAAGLVVTLTRSLIAGNGHGAIDYDGFRVNEGGEGSIVARFQGTVFRANGADGLELDERGSGSAEFTIEQSALVGNGFFSEADPDDGIDVDEAGDGDIIARFVQVEASDNAEQGVDLNENHAGDLRVTMSQVTGSGNGEEGIEFEEDDDFVGGGDLVADLVGVTASDNGAEDGDAGLKLREKGAGDLTARLVQPTASDNAIGGIEVREDAAGTLDAGVQSATASNNATTGLRLRGTGTARVQKLVAEGNGSGALVADGTVTVVEVP